MIRKEAAPYRQPDHSPVSLEDCIRLFSRREQLGDSNRWRCPDCKEEVRGAARGGRAAVTLLPAASPC